METRKNQNLGLTGKVACLATCMFAMPTKPVKEGEFYDTVSKAVFSNFATYTGAMMIGLPIVAAETIRIVEPIIQYLMR